MVREIVTILNFKDQLKKFLRTYPKVYKEQYYDCSAKKFK